MLVKRNWGWGQLSWSHVLWITKERRNPIRFHVDQEQLSWVQPNLSKCTLNDKKRKKEAATTCLDFFRETGANIWSDGIWHQMLTRQKRSRLSFLSLRKCVYLDKGIKGGRGQLSHVPLVPHVPLVVPVYQKMFVYQWWSLFEMNECKTNQEGKPQL